MWKDDEIPAAKEPATTDSELDAPASPPVWATLRIAPARVTSQVMSLSPPSLFVTAETRIDRSPDDKTGVMVCWPTSPACPALSPPPDYLAVRGDLPEEELETIVGADARNHPPEVIDAGADAARLDLSGLQGGICQPSNRSIGPNAPRKQQEPIIARTDRRHDLPPHRTDHCKDTDLSRRAFLKACE